MFGVLGLGAFVPVGIFPEPMGVISYMLVAMFASLLLVCTAAFLIGGALVDAAHKRLEGLSIALGIITLRGLPESATYGGYTGHHIFSNKHLGDSIQRQNGVARLTSSRINVISKRLNGLTRSNTLYVMNLKRMRLRRQDATVAHIR